MSDEENKPSNNKPPSSRDASSQEEGEKDALRDYLTRLRQDQQEEEAAQSAEPETEQPQRPADQDKASPSSDTDSRPEDSPAARDASEEQKAREKEEAADSSEQDWLFQPSRAHEAKTPTRDDRMPGSRPADTGSDTPDTTEEASDEMDEGQQQDQQEKASSIPDQSEEEETDEERLEPEAPTAEDQPSEATDSEEDIFPGHEEPLQLAEEDDLEEDDIEEGGAAEPETFPFTDLETPSSTKGEKPEAPDPSAGQPSPTDRKEEEDGTGPASRPQKAGDFTPAPMKAAEETPDKKEKPPRPESSSSILEQSSKTETTESETKPFPEASFWQEVGQQLRGKLPEPNFSADQIMRMVRGETFYQVGASKEAPERPQQEEPTVQPQKVAQSRDQRPPDPSLARTDSSKTPPSPPPPTTQKASWWEQGLGTFLSENSQYMWAWARRIGLLLVVGGLLVALLSQIPALLGSGDYYVHFRVSASGADQVSVVGDFNNWNPEAHTMSRLEGSRVWETWIPLEPGRYRYAYLLDGERRVLESGRPSTRNQEGGRASVIIIPQGGGPPQMADQLQNQLRQ